jgi:pyruvate,water dikinase
MSSETTQKVVRWFDTLENNDVSKVGGKNASLGEMIQTLKTEGIRVPDGFATTAEAYRQYLRANDLTGKIGALLEEMNAGDKSLAQVGKSIRRLIQKGTFPQPIERAIREAYSEIGRRFGDEEVDVAVRSSATAEDLPDASFAGQQETFLNITGADELLDACRRCYASLFTDRAISYRSEKGFDHLKVALSVGVQKMVRADEAGAGVMFTIDTETGFRDVVVINAAWGLGETVVQGSVTPDEYVVFKPPLKKGEYRPIIGKTLGEKEKKLIYARGGSRSTKTIDTSRSERNQFVLSEEEILRLARWSCIIEDHYGTPMDIEWARDGHSEDLYIVQARPETVQSQRTADSIKQYRLVEKGKVLLSGLAIGEAIAAGKTCRIKSAHDIDQFESGAILVTVMTDPDWVPIMKQAAGIVTDHGGRTSHAAIVSRELGIPAVIGCGEATEVLQTGHEITLSCAEGDQGIIYDGVLEYEETEVSLHAIPDTRTKIMINIASPAGAFRWWRLPAEGIGLARMEFIINDIIKVHPLALIHFDDLTDKKVRKKIERITRGYEDKRAYFVDHLGRGLAKIAASQYPHPVVVRMSDFKTNEYADLVGGQAFEPQENNPMLGFRGASRYYSDHYRSAFALECRAIKRVREEMGLDNVVIMIPFCRTPDEADKVFTVLADNGLVRGKAGLQVYVMAEIPSNIILAKDFAERFDGFSIGSNDLTQLVLGVDRDSTEIADLFDERNEAVKRQIRTLIETAHAADTPVGICGQAPSDFPDFAAFLVEAGIDSISLNPDSLIEVKKTVADREIRDSLRLADPPSGSHSVNK